jgi:hypothetical protein
MFLVRGLVCTWDMQDTCKRDTRDVETKRTVSGGFYYSLEASHQDSREMSLDRELEIDAQSLISKSYQ